MLNYKCSLPGLIIIYFVTIAIASVVTVGQLGCCLASYPGSCGREKKKEPGTHRSRMRLIKTQKPRGFQQTVGGCGHDYVV